MTSSYLFYRVIFKSIVRILDFMLICDIFGGAKWETLQIQVSLDECLFLVRTASQMKAFQWDAVRLISRRDIVWFLKHARILFGSDIYSTHCALNGKLEKKFSLKHGFFSTEKSIIQNRVQWIFLFFFFFFFFWDGSGNADCQLNLCLVRYWQQLVLFFFFFFFKDLV